MKSNLDKEIKNAFDNYEMPYNPSAWTSMNQKLDALQNPTATNIGKVSNFKWIAGGALALIVGAAAIYSLTTTKDETSAKSTAAVAKNTTELSSNELNQGANSSEQRTSNSFENKVVKKEKVLATAKTKNTDEQTVDHVNDNPTFNFTDTALDRLTSKGVNTTNNNNNSIIQPLQFVEIENVCVFDKVAIPNNNKVSIYIIAPSGKETEVKANESLQYTVQESGNYILTSKNKSDTTSSFVANASPKIDFVFDESNLYENGIPTMQIMASSGLTNYEWKIEGHQKPLFGQKISAHFYSKGMKQIQLKATSNGCHAEASKTVVIEEDYNLLAPSAFSPNSADSRKNHFIPAALLLRNIPFRMVIIEPRSGHIIYETTSIQGWDGVETKSGLMIEENTQYIWKVTLETPEPNERKEYSGVVIRL